MSVINYLKRSEQISYNPANFLKTIIVLIPIIYILVFSGCSLFTDDDENNGPTEPTKSAGDVYCPMSIGNSWTYSYVKLSPSDYDVVFTETVIEIENLVNNNWYRMGSVEHSDDPDVEDIYDTFYYRIVNDTLYYGEIRDNSLWGCVLAVFKDDPSLVGEEIYYTYSTTNPSVTNKIFLSAIDTTISTQYEYYFDCIKLEFVVYEHGEVVYTVITYWSANIGNVKTIFKDDQDNIITENVI